MAKVLLVDDDTVLRATVARFLERLGHQVLQVSNGAEGLTALREAENLDMVVTDLDMPVMNGEEFVHRLRLAGYGQPVAVLSGGGFEDGGPTFRGAMERGATTYLSKPCTLKRIAEVVDHLQHSHHPAIRAGG